MVAYKDENAVSFITPLHTTHYLASIGQRVDCALACYLYSKNKNPQSVAQLYFSV